MVSLTVSGFGLLIMIFMRCDGSPESFFQRCGASPLRKGEYLLYTLISCLRLVHRWKGSCQSLGDCLVCGLTIFMFIITRALLVIFPGRVWTSLMTWFHYFDILLRVIPLVALRNVMFTDILLWELYWSSCCDEISMRRLTESVTAS